MNAALWAGYWTPPPPVEIQPDRVTGKPYRASVEERLLRRRYIDPSFGCWIWTGARNAYGYGLITVDWSAGRNNLMEQTHRVAYKLWVGPIPEGLQIDHLCCNRPCGNPAHLEAVTVQVNLARRIGQHFGARRYRKECRAGHDLAIHGIERRDAPNSLRCRLCRDLSRDRSRAA